MGDQSTVTGRGLTTLLFAALLAFSSCGKPPSQSSNSAQDPQVRSLGTAEVTARLLEVPDGAIFQRELYDYATILKYEVVTVHRGGLAKGDTIFVGHYNPWKPRTEAADRRVKQIGGNVREFHAGDVHHMALESPIDDHFM